MVWLLPQALEEAEQQLQKERTELDGLLKSQSSLQSDPTQGSDEGEEESEEEKLFQVYQDCRMTSILQSALYKQEEVITLLTER